MTEKVKDLIEVTKTKASKIKDIDFDNLTFGSTFSDHMLVSNYENGQWETPKIIPYQAISLEPSSKIFHYGQSVFEGMKAYKDVDGNVFLFRPRRQLQTFEHFSKTFGNP